MNWEEASKSISEDIARKHGITDPAIVGALKEAARKGLEYELDNWLHQRR